MWHIKDLNGENYDRIQDERHAPSEQQVFEVRLASVLTALDVRAIGAKLEKMDTLSRSVEVEKDYARLAGKIKTTDELLSTAGGHVTSKMKEVADLVSAADVHVKIGTESKDILRLLEGINTRLTAIEARQSEQQGCCSIS